LYVFYIFIDVFGNSCIAEIIPISDILYRSEETDYSALQLSRV